MTSFYINKHRYYSMIQMNSKDFEFYNWRKYIHKSFHAKKKHTDLYTETVVTAKIVLEYSTAKHFTGLNIVVKNS